MLRPVMLPALFTTVLFSISAVSANRTAKLMGGTEANFWRLCVAMVLLGLYAHLSGPGLGGAGFHIFWISGCIGFGLGDVALFQALPRLGSRLTVLMVHCLAAPFAILSEWLWLGTTLSPAELLCAALILAGVALAIAPGPGWRETTHELPKGLFFGVVAAFGQGFGAVLSRVGFALDEAAGGSVDGITAAYQRIFGGVLVAGLFLVVVKRREIWERLAGSRAPDPEEGLRKRRIWKACWWLVLINALSGPALGISCYQWALQTTPTGIVLPVVALTPLVVIPLSRRLEGEKPTTRSLLGGLLAVAGVIFLKLAG